MPEALRCLHWVTHVIAVLFRHLHWILTTGRILIFFAKNAPCRKRNSTTPCAGTPLPETSAFIFVLSQVRIFRRASRAQKSPRKFHRTSIIFGVFRIFRNYIFIFLLKSSKIAFFFEKYRNLRGLEIPQSEEFSLCSEKKSTGVAQPARCALLIPSVWGMLDL